MPHYKNLKSLRCFPMPKYGDEHELLTRETRVGEFSLAIESDGRAVSPRWEGPYTYYPIRHTANYRVRLGNDSERRADVDLFIDNENMGTWRVEPFSSITVERPVKSARRFTFLRERSVSAALAGIKKHDPDNGLIRAVFRKERKRERTNFFECRVNKHLDDRRIRPQVMSHFCFDNSNSVLTNCSSQMLTSSADNKSCSIKGSLHSGGRDYTSGATVLGEHSDQRFNTVSELRDHEAPVTINVRLITWNCGNSDPKFGFSSNPVPPPLTSSEDRDRGRWPQPFDFRTSVAPF